MSETSIKIEIAGAEYSLTVKNEDIGIIEQAAALIKEKIVGFEKTYPVKDKKDVLAMVFLQTLSELMKESIQKTDEINKLQSLLEELTEMVKQHQQKVS
ncbi:MAG: Cell division protein ZapA [Bacteroidetes bacterium]|jgi:cell division protein ZapA (FtsZ GTPase activity inhibitor)|nr:Cell division protein ZapA [Bacteroidota bacterium]